MSLSTKLKSKNVKQLIKRKRPVWGGPSDEGITQSLLARYLCCRERFRLKVVEGLKPADKYENRIEYGNMWHVCEETLAKGVGDWQPSLKSYAQSLLVKYRDPNDQAAIEKAWNCVMTQFPLYIKHWNKHPDVVQRTPLLQEQVFDVPYVLPSGRTLRLKGKWDSVDLIGKGSKARVYLQENKTKSDIVEESIKRQLAFDLQTMIYFVALDYYIENYAKSGDKLFPQDHGLPAGVRYNVIRRPLGGGKHSIRPHQATSKKAAETTQEFFARLGGLITEDTDYFFMRWQSEISKEDVLKFRQRFLDPIGEQLCDWWDWVSSADGLADPFGSAIHWQHPFGVYNSVNEIGYSELDEHLATSSELGLVYSDALFPEL